MPTEASVVIVRDPVLNCIPADIEQALRTKGLAARCVEIDDFRDPGELIRRADVIVAGVSVRFDEELLRRLPSAKAIVSAVVGTDAIDIMVASRLGIAVANSPAPETSEGMAESAVLLMLACLYDLRSRESELREGRPRPQRPSARMLQGRTVGLIGFGRTGQAVARRLAGWDVELLAYDRDRRGLLDGVERLALDDVLTRSDVVSLHLSLNAETRNILDATRLACMRRGAVLVNTARGGLLDEDALARLCAEGYLHSVGLDVFAREPLPDHSPLRALDHAVLTPHNLGHTQESFAALVRMTIDNVEHVLRGAIPPHAVNADEVRSIRR